VATDIPGIDTNALFPEIAAYGIAVEEQDPHRFWVNNERIIDALCQGWWQLVHAEKLVDNFNKKEPSNLPNMEVFKAAPTLMGPDFKIFRSVVNRKLAKFMRDGFIYLKLATDLITCYLSYVYVQLYMFEKI